jgi:cytochrome P450
MQPVEVLSLDQIDLSEEGFWERPREEREGVFATLRRENPVPFFDEVAFGPLEAGPGYYVLTKMADVLYASKNPLIFASGEGATSIADLPPEFLEFFGGMINMDDPRHARQRKIVSAAFTPGMLKRVEDQVQEVAAAVVDGIASKGECDFVTEVAARMPLQIICQMMGVPEDKWDFVFERSNAILGAGDPEYVGELEPDELIGSLLIAGAELAGLMEEMVAERKENPTDDLTTALITPDEDGETLSQSDLNSFFVLLLVAGNETTRNAISHGLYQLTQHPEQKQAWLDDFDGLARPAVEEIVRYASPVIFMRRTLQEDHTLSGVDLEAGDKVLLWYASANRDEDVFEDPHAFDIARTPNNHVGFGGPGPHFCLGANLARREITLMFRELFKRLPDIHTVGEPDYLNSNFVNGIKHLRAEFTPVI